jgi:hypothetical protein
LAEIERERANQANIQGEAARFMRDAESRRQGLVQSIGGDAFAGGTVTEEQREMLKLADEELKKAQEREAAEFERLRLLDRETNLLKQQLPLLDAANRLRIAEEEEFTQRDRELAAQEESAKKLDETEAAAAAKQKVARDVLTDLKAAALKLAGGEAQVGSAQAEREKLLQEAGLPPDIAAQIAALELKALQRPGVAAPQLIEGLEFGTAAAARQGELNRLKQNDPQLKALNDIKAEAERLRQTVEGLLATVAPV